MDTLQQLGLAMGSAWTSGINLYATVAALGLAHASGMIELPPGLHPLAHPLVITVALVLYVVEFFADKVPFLDNIWDAVHTFVRPVGAAALGYVIAGETADFGSAVGAVISGSLALASHSAKATTRAAVNTSPEPFSNIFLSVAEDGLVAGLVALAIANPAITLIVVVVLTVGAVWLTVKLFGIIRRFRSRWAAKKAAGT